jgi:recombination protein U
MRSHANRGQPFEEFLEFVHARYQADGTACVHKVPTEFIPLRDGTGRVVNAKVERKSCVDYLGRYKGTPVAIEAKHTESDRIQFSRVEPHQADYMDDFCKHPEAIGIVLVSFKLQRFYAVPWQFWKAARDAWESGNGKTRNQRPGRGIRMELVHPGNGKRQRRAAAPRLGDQDRRHQRPPLPRQS